MKLVLLAVFPFPNQLRASFATLLLSAGASVLTVRALLGHKHVDTTLRYARVYDSTVAADYLRAEDNIESHSTSMRLMRQGYYAITAKNAILWQYRVLDNR